MIAVVEPANTTAPFECVNVAELAKLPYNVMVLPLRSNIALWAMVRLLNIPALSAAGVIAPELLLLSIIKLP